eukprot:RCo005180
MNKTMDLASSSSSRLTWLTSSPEATPCPSIGSPRSPRGFFGFRSSENGSLSGSFEVAPFSPLRGSWADEVEREEEREQALLSRCAGAPSPALPIGAQQVEVPRLVLPHPKSSPLTSPAAPSRSLRRTPTHSPRGLSPLYTPPMVTRRAAPPPSPLQLSPAGGLGQPWPLPMHGGGSYEAWVEPHSAEVQFPCFPPPLSPAHWSSCSEVGEVSTPFEPLPAPNAPKKAKATKRKVPVSTAEWAVVQELVRLLEDPGVNSHQGSMNLDRLRFLVSQGLPEAYAEVVEAGGGDKPTLWSGLLRRHRGTLGMVPSTSGPRRVYLTSNRAWRQHDEAMKEGQAHHEEYIVACLESFLEPLQGSGGVGLQDFIEAYPTLPFHQSSGGSPPPLPPRGNLARLLRRNHYEVDEHLGYRIVEPSRRASR